MFHVEQSAGADASFRSDRDRTPLPCCTWCSVGRQSAFPREATREPHRLVECRRLGVLAIWWSGGLKATASATAQIWARCRPKSG